MAVTDESATAVAGVVDVRAFTDLTETGDAHTRAYYAEPFEPSGGRAGETLTVLWTERSGVQYDRLITGVAAVFAVLTGMLTVVGLLVNPAVLFLALMFGASTYFMYYHASGKLAAGVYERVERRAARGGADRRSSARRGGFGAGPREEWTGPRDGRNVRDVAREARRRASNGGRRQRQQRQAGRQRQRTRRARRDDGPSVAEAYQRLDLEQGADESAVKTAYREKVKEVHPDTDSGTEREFKQVKAAYERLTDD